MAIATATKPRLLTGDTPTGPLHLGHWVGTVENRVKLQNDFDCYFLLANVHAFTTRYQYPEQIREHTLAIALDWLAAGIDPDKSTLFIQSEIPAIAELTCFFSMLVPYPRLMRNPTIKDEIRDKGLGDNYPFGFLLYPIGQIADILCFRPDIVPVGEDQEPHLELTREIARRFNQLYCGVDVHCQDSEQLANGGLFPIVKTQLGRVKRLVGITGPDAQGRLLKMSKSLNNAIFLSDDADTIRQKVMKMYTDPQRIHAHSPGQIENNPLWIFHDIFTADRAWVEDAKQRYQAGQIGDVECKKKLVDALVALIEPMQQRRKLYQQDPGEILRILKKGAERANAIAEETLSAAKKALRQDYDV